MVAVYMLCVGDVRWERACVCVCEWIYIYKQLKLWLPCTARWLMVAVHVGLHFWVDWSQSTWADTRWKSVGLSTTKSSKTFCTAYSRTHCRETHTHTHTEWHKHTPHPQIYIPTSSAWRSTCQLLPVAGRDGLCWFCEAHRQDPPGDCRSPAAQTSSLIHSAAQAICFLYCQAVSLYYAL